MIPNVFKYSQFSLCALAMFYEISMDAELTNTERLLLEARQG